MIGDAVHRERHVGVGPVYRAGRGVHKVLDAIVPAAFEHVQRAADVAAHVGVRILQRVAHARLGCQMHHPREFLAGEELRHGRVVGKIELDGAELRRGEAPEARLLESHVVVVIEVIESDDLVAGIE
jgi:hypothetical protein